MTGQIFRLERNLGPSVPGFLRVHAVASLIRDLLVGTVRFSAQIRAYLRSVLMRVQVVAAVHELRWASKRTPGLNRGPMPAGRDPRRFLQSSLGR